MFEVGVWYGVLTLHFVFECQGSSTGSIPHSSFLLVTSLEATGMAQGAEFLPPCHHVQNLGSLQLSALAWLSL